MGSHPKLVLFDSELIKDFYTNQNMYRQTDVFRRVFHDFLPSSMTMTEGDLWRKQRKLMAMTFHFDYIKDMIPEITSISEEMMEKMRSKDAVNMRTLFNSISGEILGRLFFGDTFKEFNMIRGVHVGEFLSRLLDRVARDTFNMRFYMFSFWLSRSNKDMKDLRDLSQNMMNAKLRKIREEKQTIQEKRRKDLVELFIEQRVQSTEDSLSEDEILDQYLSFMIAGVPAMGVFMTTSMYYLQSNPEIAKNLMSEMTENFKDLERMNLDRLNKMEFASAFIKEVLRIAHPTQLLNEREAVVDHRLGNLIIKKGTYVIPGLIGNNFDSRYHNEPEKFLPERWISASKSQESVRDNPFLFTPFGLGPRNCIGQHLAQIEAKIMLGTFLKRFEFGGVQKDYQMRMTQRFVHEPLNDLRMRLVETEGF
jgi:cytochrome P450